MRKIYLLIVLLFSLMLFNNTAIGKKSKTSYSYSTSTKWTYKIIRINLRQSTSSLEDKLNEYGSQGWELVAVHSDEHYAVCFFKR